MTSITVTDLVLNFANACRCLVPALERAEVPWQDYDQWDNWDRIAQPLFESLVSEPCVYAAVGDRSAHLLRVPRYGFDVDGPECNAWITLRGATDKRMIGLSTDLQPFDRVDLIDQDKRVSIVLDNARFAFSFVAADHSEQELTVVDLAAA